MKCLLSALLLFLLLPVLVLGQQNHVLNGDFEYYTSCPQSRSQIFNVQGWSSYHASVDYVHTCAITSSITGVPQNFAGYQWPASGNGYVLYGNSFSSVPVRESFTRTIQPLQIGYIYEVSVSVCLAEWSGVAVNDIGIYFFDNGPTSASGTTFPIPPQVDYSSYGILTDTQNWVRMTKYYYADSAYDNIVIGSLKDISNIDTIHTGFGLQGICFIAVDSVVVKIADTLYYKITDSAFCAGDTFSTQCFTFNPYNSNNVFTAQISDATGSFNFPTNIGSMISDTSGTITCTLPSNISPGNGYKLRIIASSPADTSFVTGPIIKIGNPDSTNINTSSNSPLCEGSTLQLSASTFVSGTTYTWVGPASFSSTSASPSIAGVLPVQDGDYRVTMKWYGCEVKDTLYVTVKPLPAKPVANNNSPLCAGDSLHLSSVSSTSGVSYSWARPGSFSSAAQDTSIANTTTAMSGDYIVTANLNGCNRKDTTTVLVKPLPAAVTLGNNGPICAGDTLHLSSTASSTGVSYSWTGPGSFSAATQNTNRTNSTAGMTGWYKMLVGLNGCSYSDSTYATIHPIPAVPNISYTNPLCLGETLNLGTATISGATYSWAGPNNFSAAVQTLLRSNMQFGDTGTYKLTTTVNGCTSDTGTATVRINPLPFVVIFANPADSICQRNRVNFTALPNNHGGSPACQWYVNGQASGAGAAFSTTTLNDQDVVRVDMTENTKCSAPYTDPSNDITMNVLPWLAPTVNISVNPNRPLKEYEYATFTATATNAGNNPQYQWKRNGQDIVGATGSVWSANTLNDNDSISVEIVSSYKCPQPTKAVSNGIVVKVLTGVAGLNNKSGLILYPNPNNGKFVLKGEALTSDVLKIEIINAMGQVVYRGKMEAGNGRLHKEINLSDVSPGIYLLKLQGQESTSMLRFTVQ